jgi:hypothetical protein
MGKAVNTISVIWHANLCHLTPNCYLNVLCLQIICHTVSASAWESEQLHGLRSGQYGGCCNTSHLQHCRLCSIFTLYPTIKWKDNDWYDMWFACLLPVASAHIPPSVGNIY